LKNNKANSQLRFGTADNEKKEKQRTANKRYSQ